MSEEAATGVLPPPPPAVDAVAVEVTADSAVAVAEVQTADERAIEQIDKMMKLFMPGIHSLTYSLTHLTTYSLTHSLRWSICGCPS